ncbi:hypothetical protein PanWU01x14_034880 [Parasponia andersonii]|uniref:Uncharacterized protein n=1 Tax=Parasponia andersonii TaxID=3476 RepID=A0A2P5DT19_PARAD|nr:hypothetical protein PanWU01x14_034880 [Parasponia andersonii]
MYSTHLRCKLNFRYPKKKKGRKKIDLATPSIQAWVLPCPSSCTHGRMVISASLFPIRSIHIIILTCLVRISCGTKPQPPGASKSRFTVYTSISMSPRLRIHLQVWWWRNACPSLSHRRRSFIFSFILIIIISSIRFKGPFRRVNLSNLFKEFRYSFKNF